MKAAIGTLPLGLRDVQRLLFDAVIASQAEAARGLEPRLTALVAGDAVSALRRVSVYRDGYRARLVECLADDYPAVRHLLGQNTFESLCCDYVRDVPPGITLNTYGAAFAEYCCHHAPRHGRLASELAQLEWALVTAIHASDARQLGPEHLAELSLDAWETVRLVPSPTLTLLATVYPVNLYFQALRDDRAPEPPDPASSSVIVCRSGIDLWRIDLPAHLGKLFERLVAGEPLAKTLASVSSGSFGGDAALDPAAAIRQAFSQWMRAGCFSGITEAGAG